MASFLQVFWPKLFPHACYMPLTCRLSWFDHPIIIRWRVQVMMFLSRPNWATWAKRYIRRLNVVLGHISNRSKHLVQTEMVCLEVSFQTCIQDVLGSNLCQNIRLSWVRWFLFSFSPPPPGKYRDNISLRPRPLHYSSFTVHSSLIRRCIVSIPKVSLNSQRK
jgi:hypothetical protein